MKNNLRRDIPSLMAWSACGPVLASWPMVSALPLVSLVAGPNTVPHVTIQTLLLVTGFWGVAIGAWALWTMLNLQSRRDFRSAPRSLGLPLAIYATVWTIVYAFVVYAR